MKIVIDFPVDLYCEIQAYKTVYESHIGEIADAICKGIPLQEVPTIDDVLDNILREIFYKQYDHLGCGNCGEDISFGLTLAAQIIYKYKNRK